MQYADGGTPDDIDSIEPPEREKVHTLNESTGERPVTNGWSLDRLEFLRQRIGGDPKRATAVFEAAVEWSGGGAAQANAGGGTLAFDEPAWSGGGGKAAHPVEAVLATLGASVAAGIAAAAAQAGCPIRALSLHVEGGVDLARTLGIVDRRPVIDLVQIEVAIEAAADGAVIEGWLAEAVARSPIAGLFAAAGQPVQARLVASEAPEPDGRGLGFPRPGGSRPGGPPERSE